MNLPVHPVRQFSSSWTGFFKLLFPPLWVIATLYVVLPYLLDPAGQWNYRHLDGWGMLALAMVSWAFVCNFALRIKYVSLDGQTLVIRGYHQSIRLPLQDVERIWMEPPLYGRARRGSLISIEPRLPTPFGSKIDFYPKLSIYYFGEHPFVQQLTDLARAAKGLEP